MKMFLQSDSTNVSIAYTLLSTNTADYQPNGADVVFGMGHLTNDPPGRPTAPAPGRRR